jgi:hypothetical protein
MDSFYLICREVSTLAAPSILQVGGPGLCFALVLLILGAGPTTGWGRHWASGPALPWGDREGSALATAAS